MAAMISMKEHKSIVQAYQDRIVELQNQLHSVKMELKDFKKRDDNLAFLNQNEIEFEHKIRQSTMILDDLIGIDDDIEDVLTEDDIEDNVSNRKITKSLLNHDRRATSLILEDLIGINDDFEIDDDSDSDSTEDHDVMQNIKSKQHQTNIDSLISSKITLIKSLSLELDKMRSIIVKQQNRINHFKQNALKSEKL